MGVRKNARLLTAAEREAFVQACVLMKADIVNPGAPAANRYSKWDELVALHRMIQSANAPGAANVNFGHGGAGAFSFLSWHRFFLLLFEQRLQGYVPGVMLPYWDWSDPAPIMTDTFLGPNGAAGTTIVSRGYFARNAPGTPGNPTPAPPWWPAGLSGWNLVPGFGAQSGPLRRALSPVDQLPSVADLRDTLAKVTYSTFQNALEGGTGLPSGHPMHNGLHGWVGGQMATLTASPFDPLFYLHHCNIDRLWAMWQLDGHADEYPDSGGDPQHHRNDIMYPWTGGLPGYSSNFSLGSIVLPDFSALGPKRNVDTLDHRALGYTYDTMSVVGIGLDRTGSMLALTPDPMTTGAPDVTKWEAAKRGVSAFLQDCETVYDSAVSYVTAGIKTFRRTGPDNDFTSLFPGTPFGLVRSGGAYSRGVFDSTVAGLEPGGTTPLADALQDVQDTLVEPPFGGLPADEQRYLAMLTDGLQTSGSPMASIPDGSFTDTVVFGMGFGTAAEVDFATVAALVAKGRTLTTPQVFNGANAGTIDKFYSNALAAAIGFTNVFDPVLELFAGEHVHLDFDATSAEDALFFTAQGMDFLDENWSFHVTGPDGHPAYADGVGHLHAPGTGHGGRRPHVTARRGTGRLSLVVQRDSAPASAWVGTWRLMAAYRAKDLDGMAMPDIGELLYPVSAGPARGPRFARLLMGPQARPAVRSVVGPPVHRLDVPSVSTNRSDRQACNLTVNIYARTRLRVELASGSQERIAGEPVTLDVTADTLAGGADLTRGLARLVASTQDLRGRMAQLEPSDIPESARLEGSEALRFDPTLVLAGLERQEPDLGRQRDEEVDVVQRAVGLMSVHVQNTQTPGVYSFGVYVEGTYCPDHNTVAAGPPHEHQVGPAHEHGDHGHDQPDDGQACGPACPLEHFFRVLSTSVAIQSRSSG